MSESNEIRIKNEINEISNTIDSILKKIEQEREKLQLQHTEDTPPEDQTAPEKDTREVEDPTL